MTSVPPVATTVSGLRRRLSRKKRCVFFLLMAAATYLVVELISFVGLYFVCGGWSVAQRHAEGDAGPDFFGTGIDNPEEIVHPYLGFVRRPRSKGADNDGGMQVTDLTTVFADHSEPTYKDPCCHLNSRGNELLAQKIAEVIRRSFDSE